MSVADDIRHARESWRTLKLIEAAAERFEGQARTEMMRAAGDALLEVPADYTHGRHWFAGGRQMVLPISRAMVWAGYADAALESIGAGR